MDERVGPDRTGTGPMLEKQTGRLGPLARVTLTALFSLALPLPSLPAENPRAGKNTASIRVGLPFSNNPVQIKANPHLIVSSETGPLFSGRTLDRIRVEPGPRGLALNRQETSFQKITLASPGGLIQVNDLTVMGRISILQGGGSLTVVNTLPLEDYLKGVVPVEISAEWHPEVLKVQAIISRTYARYQMESNRGKAFDLVSTIEDQVYSGVSREHPAANRAIMDTRGEVLAFDGRILQAFFHSTSAGPTENAMEVWGINLPYLQGVSCPFDSESPYFEWTVSIPLEQIQQSLKKKGYRIGTIATVSTRSWTRAGRVEEVRILHSKGELFVKGPEFRKLLGYTRLPSTRFIIAKTGASLQLQGLGAGHAVGLCQWGAKEMAEKGYSHRAILQHYYPGSVLVHQSSLEDRPRP